MKFSKAQIVRRFQKIPHLRFEEQSLSSFAGLILFQTLFMRLDLGKRLRERLAEKGRRAFGRHVVALLLIVHLLLGYRRLREIDYYRDDPLVLRAMGLRRLPDRSTVSRVLSKLKAEHVAGLRDLSREIVTESFRRGAFARLTLDFDGSVLSTKGRAEGTAVGFNPKKKGARSYYPLFCTVAQTGQFFDLHHRSGNVHDSNGAADFMAECFGWAVAEFPDAQLEARLDSAHFSEDTTVILEEYEAEFTASVPFERLVELKGKIERRRRWRKVDSEWSYFEEQWKPHSWEKGYRFIFIRRKVKRQEKGPLQLDFFRPMEFDYEYKVIVTNKKEAAESVLLFHHGRGSQEGIFGEAKQHAGLDVIPTRRLHGNQFFTICSMMAHNLARELQMLANPPDHTVRPKRPAAWRFMSLGVLRHRLVQRAGRLIRPQGELTLSMSANPAARREFLNLLEGVKRDG